MNLDELHDVLATKIAAISNNEIRGGLSELLGVLHTLKGVNGECIGDCELSAATDPDVPTILGLLARNFALKPWITANQQFLFAWCSWIQDPDPMTGLWAVRPRKFWFKNPRFVPPLAFRVASAAQTRSSIQTFLAEYLTYATYLQHESGVMDDEQKMLLARLSEASHDLTHLSAERDEDVNRFAVLLKDALTEYVL